MDPTPYKRRNLVERRINRLKQWRGIATRDDKPPLPGAITLISALLLSNT
ncbi:hypothetical protein KLI87_39000 [Actinomadura sp. NEAU-AAG7]|nr:hypothetical protein [Actinomadura sp. NEAU-AAG7]